MKFNICKKLIAFLVLSLMVAPFSAFASEEGRGLGRSRWSIGTLDDYFSYVNAHDLPRTLIIGAGRAENYAKENYGENAMAYFLVDEKKEFKPDYRCDINDMESLNQLGLGQWDIIVLEGLPIDIYLEGTGINNVYKLLRSDGCITFLLDSFLLSEYYFPMCKRELFESGIMLPGLEREKLVLTSFKLLEDSYRNRTELSSTANASIMKNAFKFDVKDSYDIWVTPAAGIFGLRCYPKYLGMEDFKSNFIVFIRKLPEE